VRKRLVVPGLGHGACGSTFGEKCPPKTHKWLEDHGITLEGPSVAHRTLSLSRWSIMRGGGGLYTALVAATETGARAHERERARERERASERERERERGGRHTLGSTRRPTGLRMQSTSLALSPSLSRSLSLALPTQKGRAAADGHMGLVLPGLGLGAWGCATL